MIIKQNLRPTRNPFNNSGALTMTFRIEKITSKEIPIFNSFSHPSTPY